MSEIYVAHIGTSIFKTGTKAECETHRDEQPYNTSSWRISDLESYGDACYSEGFDSGYDAGANNE